jgi:hypothetical protein
VGYHYALELKKEGIPITYVRGQAKPRDPIRFARAKDEMYWDFREALRLGRVSHLLDEITISQAVSVRWREDSQGRIVVETKDELRKRGIKSPDRLECCVFAFSRNQGLAPGSPGTRAASGRSFKRRQTRY